MLAGPSPAGGGEGGRRRPPLAVALRDVPARHSEELDELARTLGALEAQSAAVGPRLRQEQQEVQRLRRDLARSDQESRAAGHAQEQHARGRERHEAWQKGEEEYSERLEAEAAVLLLQSPAALRQARLEVELEQLQAQCQSLEWDVQAFSESHGAEERRVWSLADAAARRGVELGFAEDEGGRVLCGLAGACDVIARSCDRLAAERSEAEGTAEAERAMAAEIECLEEVGAARSLRAEQIRRELAVSRATRDADADAALAGARDSLADLQGVVSEFRASHASLEAELSDSDACGERLLRLQERLRPEAEAADAAAERATAAKSAAAQRVSTVSAQLALRLSDGDRQSRRLVDGLAGEDAAARALGAGLRRLREEVLAQEEECGELARLRAGRAAECEELALRGRQEREACSARQASERGAASRCGLLRARLEGELRSEEEARRTASRLLAEQRAAADEAASAAARCEAALAGASSASGAALAERDAALAEQLRVRGELQADLAHEVAAAAEELRSLQRRRDASLREAAGLRRESARLRSLVLGDG